MKDIKAIRGKFYIQRLIEEGEHEHQDFKFAISDARKISRSISAFANNDGGRLLIGVKDNGNIAGVRSEEDIYMIEQAAQMYCRPAQDVKITAFSTEGGAIVIRAEISRSDKRPVKSQEPDGSWRAYYRVKDENILAPAIMVKAWKCKESHRGEIVKFSDVECSLLRLLDDKGTTTVDEYARYAHISNAIAESIVVKLCAMDVVAFVYMGGEFRLAKL